MNPITRSLTLLIVLFVLGGGTGTPVSAQTPAPQPMLGTEAPGFTLATVQGDSLGLRDLRGTIVVIHFGTSW